MVKNHVFLHKNTLFECINIRVILQYSNYQVVIENFKNKHFFD